MSTHTVINTSMDQAFTDYFIVCDGCGVEVPSPVYYAAVTPSDWKEVIKPAVFQRAGRNPVKFKAVMHHYCPQCQKDPHILQAPKTFIE